MSGPISRRALMKNALLGAVLAPAAGPHLLTWAGVSTAAAAEIRTRVVAEGLAFTECPRWHADRLWFSDILAGEVLAVDGKGGKPERIVALPEITGDSEAWPTGLGWDTENRLMVVSMKDCKLLRETKAGSRKFAVLADLSSIYSHHCNDMVVDSMGRAYVGGYSFDVVKGESPKPSALALVMPDGTVKVVSDETLMMPNAMALLDEGRTLVVAESRGARLTAFDVNPRDGLLSKKRVWATLANGPDGICADAERCIWVSSPPTHEFLRVREGGEIVDRISTGDRRAIACMLGGTDRRTLFMCTNKPSPPGAGAKDLISARRSLIEAAPVTVPGAGLP
jgi:sugar lactone lactonase YvrE